MKQDKKSHYAYTHKKSVMDTFTLLVICPQLMKKHKGDIVFDILAARNLLNYAICLYNMSNYSQDLHD